MTIARDIQTVPLNWDGGVVGTNGINRGHSTNSSSGLLAADVTGDPDDNPCVGYTNGRTCSDATWHVNKRTHKLSNDSVIWDLAGNVWEWVDWYELSTTCGSLSANQYLPSPLYTSAQQFGRWYGGSGGAAVRSGGTTSGDYVGVFTLRLGNTPSDFSADIGFRCVFRP